ncbi:MAG: hypothetical protein CSYNP_02837 [Syntrophus sp. SKADARSKE-3]|nr:hypothetical protein [Syntrophus sp. SKADARSKE-3]
MKLRIIVICTCLFCVSSASLYAFEVLDGLAREVASTGQSITKEDENIVYQALHRGSWMDGCSIANINIWEASSARVLKNADTYSYQICNGEIKSAKKLAPIYEPAGLRSYAESIAGEAHVRGASRGAFRDFMIITSRTPGSEDCSVDVNIVQNNQTYDWFRVNYCN